MIANGVLRCKDNTKGSVIPYILCTSKYGGQMTNMSASANKVKSRRRDLNHLPLELFSLLSVRIVTANRTKACSFLLLLQSMVHHDGSDRAFRAGPPVPSSTDIGVRFTFEGRPVARPKNPRRSWLTRMVELTPRSVTAHHYH